MAALGVVGPFGAPDDGAMVQKRRAIYGRQQLMAEAQARGVRSALYYPYVTNTFVIENWDFPA
jgi:hypothetical protein